MNRFERALALLAVHEGGYVNHPKDPGGATNKGVTQRTYNAYRRRKNRPYASVRQITDEDVTAIYREQYWDAIRADDLPSGVAYCVSDAAVNSGPGQAARWLQEIVGAQVDGVVGNETIGLTEQMEPASLIDAYCDRRLAFMRRLRTWPTFGKGWSRRVAEVRAQAKEWAKGAQSQPSQVGPQPIAAGPETATATVKDMLTDKGAIGAVGGVVGASASLASGDGPVQYALAAVLIIAALAGVWWLVRRK